MLAIISPMCKKVLYYLGENIQQNPEIKESKWADLHSFDTKQQTRFSWLFPLLSSPPKILHEETHRKQGLQVLPSYF